MSISYDAKGNTTGTTLMVSSLTNKNASGGTISQYSYTYDALGNITAISGSTSASYTYDNQGQLLTETVGGVTYTYTYDTYGNLRSKTDGTTTDTYTYGDSQWLDLLTAYNGNAISYDAIGNPTTWYDGTTFTWVNGRRLASATNTAENLTATYTYDSDGLRLTKTVGGVEHKYLWQGSKLVSEYYDGKELEFFYDESGNPYAFSYKASSTATPVTYYYLTNLQGDITGILDASGTSVAAYTYNAWGKLLSSSGDMADVNPLRYRGYYYDAELEMYYLQSRYYDPEICRFINADCYVSSDQSFIGCNMFAYCGNNPVTGYDPTGEWDFGTFLGGAGLIATGAIAIATAATILTCGAAAPLMVAVAAVTASAGALTVVNGTAEVAESVTGYNVIRDGAFGGNSAAYGAYRNGTKIVAEIGTALCAGYYAAKQGSICFVAGTLVAASTGNVPIEEIQVGDYVWAWDEETGETALKQVVETYVNETDELVHVFVHGEEIVATPSHPFYSPVKGWIAAVHLRAGDILVLVNGEYVVVEEVQHELLESPVKVYNFQVEDYHTYYVSSDGILTHNSCSAPRRTSDQQALADIADETVRNARRGKFISYDEARMLDDWAVEYGVSQHHQAVIGSGLHWITGWDHTHIYNIHVPFLK